MLKGLLKKFNVGDARFASLLSGRKPLRVGFETESVNAIKSQPLLAAHLRAYLIGVTGKSAVCVRGGIAGQVDRGLPVTKAHTHANTRGLGQNRCCGCGGRRGVGTVGKKILEGHHYLEQKNG